MEDRNLTEMILSQHEVYSEDFCRWVLYKTALGLLHMHNKNILHRDIKSDNILCDSKGDIKISDLGFSAYLTAENSRRTSRCGTINWISPEIVQRQEYSMEVDVWAYGSFAYELATGFPLFNDIKDKQELLDHIQNKPIPPISTNRWSPLFQDFINKCLEKDVNKRLSIKQLVFDHDFLKNIDVNQCRKAYLHDYELYL